MGMIYRDAHQARLYAVKTRKIRAVAVAEIFMNAYSGMMLIPISDINLSTPAVYILNARARACFYRGGSPEEEDGEFLSSAERGPAPSCEPSSGFSSYLTRVIYVNATKSLTIFTCILSYGLCAPGEIQVHGMWMMVAVNSPRRL